MTTARETENVDSGATPWYVTDPNTGATMRVEADAKTTPRWVAWSQWYGALPRTENDDRHYISLKVVPIAEDPA